MTLYFGIVAAQYLLRIERLSCRHLEQTTLLEAA